MLEIVRSLLSFILREVGFIMVLCERQHAMNIKVCLVVLLLFHAKVLSSSGISTNGSSIPGTLNIGALMSFNSSVGKVAKLAIETAVNDVNSDQTVLASTNLQLTFQDTDYGGYLGMVETLSLTGKETVAIVGPQFSVTAHVISHIVNELQVPMLSFAATDPTLSSLQYPFFVRTTQSDVFQMAAIADIVDFYGWRDVIAIYVDDDHGRNGIAALGDILAQRRCKISHKAPLSPEPSQNDITNVLVNVAVVESRILVLLTYPNWGLEVFRVANYLGMTGTGYVWIVTDWLSTVLDSQSPLPSEAMDDIQGVLTFRMYAPDSQRKKEFASRWANLTAGSPEEDKSFLGLTTYGLYAYDTVWLLAYAIDEFLNRGGNISFSHDPKLKELHGGNTHLHTLSIFNEGKLLLNSILQVNKTGLTGQLKFTSDKNLIHPAYEVINVAGTGFRRIGYWSNNSGLSVVPPEMLYNKPSNSSSKQLYSVIWPGETTHKPRGWVFPNNGRHLRIGVPNRVIYREFVSVDGPDSFTGYCIDVFTAAINLLPYAVPYKFYAFGDGKNNPETSELLQSITAGVYDAAVGDLAITTDGIRMVDFTQPFVQSGLVVVAPVRKLNSNAWAFLRPFTAKMWAVTGIFFLAVGVVVWILEHRINDDFRGPPKRQIVTILWFSFSTLFFAHKENARGTLGRLVLIIWLFVVLILNSSYTASLTSILTVEQLYSPIKGIKSLVSSHEPIGYQRGSFTESYLIEEYKIDKSRLVPLNSINDYAKALKDGPNKGGVAAVIDQRTYIELFLSSRCEFSIVGQEFSKIGWGFAFPRDSPLAFDMSTAILKLAEGGDLQRIHDKWLLRSACSLEGAKQDADRLQLKSFWGLYLLCGLACLLALLLHLIKMVRQFGKHYPGDLESTAQGSASVRFHTFLSFIDEKINETNRESKRRKLERGSNRSIAADESVPGSFKSNASDM